MKILMRIIIFLLLVALVGFTIFFIIGYSTYSKALEEKPLITRIDEITEKENYVPFDELSKNYINAVVAVEDRRYYEHGAIDPIGIARAIWVNITNWDLREGGSTITQQVAKNVIFSQEDTIPRKLGEIIAAFDLEKNYSKDEILAI